MKYEIELDAENVDTICVMTKNNNNPGIIEIKDFPVKPIEKSKKQYEHWRAPANEFYYYINTYDDIYKSIETYTPMDNEFYQKGNYYKTKEEAEFAIERQRVMNKLELYSIKDVSKIDRENGFYILICDLNKDDNQIIKPTRVYSTIDPFTFAKLEDAEAAIEAIGIDRLKKYYFRVG